MFPALRKAILTIFLLLSVIALANCGRNPTPESQEPAELLWVTLDVNSQVEETLAANYRQENPHITFQRQYLSADLATYLSTTPPDILMSFANRQFHQAGSDSQLADLNDVWQAASFGDNVISNVQDVLTHRESGAIHMMPVAFAWAAIYYNKAIFEQYNLQPPQTWDEFLQICAILQANGEIPLAMAGRESYAYTLWFDYLNLRINGAAFHRDLLAGRERYDDPRVAIVLDIWRTLFDQGFVVPRPEMMNAQDALNALVRNDNGLLGREKAAMALMDTYTLSATPAELRTELDFFRFPIIDPNMPVAEVIDVIGYVVPSEASHRPQAMEFLTYLASPTAQTLIAREASVINVVYAAVRTDIEEDAITPEMAKAIAMVQAAAEGVPFTYQGLPPDLWAEFNRAYRQLLSEPYDSRGFMDAMETARQKALEAGTLEQ
jgi:raffinose/stachyose/melibiose transport system substrate-binding protein